MRPSIKWRKPLLPSRQITIRWVRTSSFGGQGGNLVFTESPGLAPGSGGGGSGAIGNNAKGGQGGGGGEIVEVEIGPQEMQKLREAGFDRVEFRVGKGGESGGPR